MVDSLSFIALEFPDKEGNDSNKGNTSDDNSDNKTNIGCSFVLDFFFFRFNVLRISVIDASTRGKNAVSGKRVAKTGLDG